MIIWCVAHTQPQKENIAQQHLLDQGFEVYVSRFKKLRKHARKVDEVLVPLFPRYIFVGIDLNTAPWRSINGTRGVSYLMMSDDRNPSRVPLGVIDNLKSQEISEAIVPLHSLVNFVHGDSVRILEGGFKDQRAVFESFGDKGRVQLLLSLLGKDVMLSLPYYAVEAA